MIKKNPALLLAVVLTLAFGAMAFYQVGFLENIELTTYDLRMKIRANGPETRTDIAIVDIDDYSINRLGKRWPWPRSFIAQMVDKLKSYGSAYIGLNVMFSEPEVDEGLKVVGKLREEFEKRYGGLKFPDVKNFAQKFDSVEGAEMLKFQFEKEFGEFDFPDPNDFLVVMEDAEYSLDSDQLLMEAMANAENVVLPLFFKLGGYNDVEEERPEWQWANALIGAQGELAQGMVPAKEITAPIDLFANMAIGLGHINVWPDEDGTLRQDLPVVDYKGLPIVSYTLRLALLAQGLPLDQVKVLTMARDQQQGLQIGDMIVPTGSWMKFYVTFTSPKAFEHYSFFDVINDKVDPSAFKGKIVLIGASATGVDIPQVTPISNSMSTANYAANVIHNLLNGGFLVRSEMMVFVELIIILIVGVFLSVLLPRLKARAGALISLGGLILIVGAGIFLFVGPGIWLKITYPVLLILIGYAAVTTTRYFVTEKHKDKVEGESAEINRMLGLSFQNQGQLDMAFDKFRRVPVDDSMKEVLYNLALDYERKRMFNKAVAVYEYIKEHDEAYKDISDKIRKLKAASDTMIFGLGSGAKQAEDGTLMIDENTKPTLGRYEIQRELGKGAMGIVYMGKDPKIGREMAIKTIRFTDEYEEEEAERIKEQFFREAETAGMLSHPNIVTIYDAGEDHDLSYIAMEYLDGADLKDYAAPGKLLSIRDVIRLVADVADALGYAHSKGVVHRDIKPANIMLLKSGVAKVTDFGIARAMASSKTKTGVVKGTPFYMSPEQITGKKVDGRSDIYSLGVVLYEMLTGVQPFRADDLTALIYKITSEDPEPITIHNPKIPKAVAQIIERALTKDRDKRYQKAEQLAEHLRIVGRKMDEIAAKRQASGG